MEKPRKRMSISIFSSTGMFKKDNFYLTDEMDTYLAQKDKEISELVEALRLRGHVHAETDFWVTIHLPNSGMILDIMKKDLY